MGDSKLLIGVKSQFERPMLRIKASRCNNGTFSGSGLMRRWTEEMKKGREKPGSSLAAFVWKTGMRQRAVTPMKKWDGGLKREGE